MEIKNKKILVTGGAGFIGSHVVDRLIGNNEMVVLDDFQKGNRDNVKHHFGKPNFSVVSTKMDDFQKVKEALEGVDIVFHLAARTGVKKCMQSPFGIMNDNIIATQNLFKALRSSDVGKIVYTSSSEVYGAAVKIPIDEEQPTNPFTSYGLSKLVGEFYCTAYQKEFGLDCVIFRFFNTYGPRVNLSEFSYVIPIFIKNVLCGKPPMIHGNGMQTRAFSYISDIIDGIMLGATSKRIMGEVFNLGSTEEITVKDLAFRIIKLCGKRVEPVFDSPIFHDISRRVPDVSKARRILGFEHKVSFDDGLKRTIDWVNSVL